MEYSSVAARVFRIQEQVLPGINDRDDARVAAGRRIEGGRRDRGHPWVEGAELSGQHALAEPPVAPPQHRSAVGGELHRGTQAWRQQVPGVQRSQTADDLVGFASLGSIARRS